MTLAITCGEPAGIGPELCVRLAGMDLPAPVVAIGDATLLAERAEHIGCPVSITPFDDAITAHTPGTLVLQILQDGIEQLTAKELDEVFRIADHEVARRLARAHSKDDGL